MSVWTVKATGGRRGVDAAEVRRALSALVDPEHGVQVQALPSGRWEIHPGTDLDALCAAAERLSDERGVYFALNPCPAGRTTPINREAMLCRRWILLDADPARPKDTNATEAEHDLAGAAVLAAMDGLTARGWPAPLVVDSGNGWHLLYRVDLPNDELARALVKGCIHAVADQFPADGVEWDRSVHNANRISKLPGTWARKGPHTSERPHRLARLVVLPEQVEPVSVELLRALAEGVSPVTTPLTQPPRAQPFRVRAVGEPEKAYARAAIRYECDRLKLTPVGKRNVVLNRVAFVAGTFLHVLQRQEVETELELAAYGVGLLADEPEKTRDTLRRALDAGAEAKPRVIPPVGVNGVYASQSAKPSEGEALTVCAASVTPKRVEWLMPNRIPKRFVTVFAGRTGLGKSFVTCDIIARLTRGGEIPFGGGEVFERGGALFISEDPHDYMLTPRLIEHNADLSLVQFMTWDAMAAYTLADTEMLDRAFSEVVQPRLVVIDPPTNFLGEADEHRNAEVRQTLMRLVGWIQKVDAACILIMHVNKQTGKGIEALNRVLGSVAWVSTSRIAHSFAQDPEDADRRLFVPMKNNLGPIGNGLAYRILKTDGLARVEWLAEVDITADDAMNHTSSRRRRAVAAAEWLEELFAAGDEVPSKTIFRRTESETKLSTDALREAKEDMGILARQRYNPDGDRQWVWIWLPEARQRWANQKQSGSQMGEELIPP